MIKLLVNVNAQQGWPHASHVLQSNKETNSSEYRTHVITVLADNCFFHGTTAPSGPGSLHYPGFTTTLGRTPLD